MAEKRIDDVSKVLDIGTFNEIVSQKEIKPRICPIHNESVSQRPENVPDVSDISLQKNQHPVLTPLFSIAFSGCCPEAIDSEIEFIDLTLKEHRKNIIPKIIGL
jgi:hypothetical protein